MAEPAVRLPVEVSIVIPTFRRVEFLTELVRRCRCQARSLELGVEIVVVDNCPRHSAQPAIEALRPDGGPPLRYVSEMRPGVSHVRNAGILAARGRLIVFIDDDELPGEGWLAALLACQMRHGADIVMGPVYPILPKPEVQQSSFLVRHFTQTSARPTGTVIRPPSLLSVLFRRSCCYRTMATNNVLLDRARCITSIEPFAPALGRFGGEDVLFFHDLHLAGRRIVWCAEAAVFDRIPPERLGIPYLLRKRFRDGQITSSTCVMTTPRQPVKLAASMVIGFAQLALGTGRAALFAGFARDRAKAGLCLAAGGAGKLLWMRRFRAQAYGTEVLPGGKPMPARRLGWVQQRLAASSRSAANGPDGRKESITPNPSVIPATAGTKSRSSVPDFGFALRTGLDHDFEAARQDRDFP